MPDPTPREKIIGMLMRAFEAGSNKQFYIKFSKNHHNYKPEFHEWFINQQKELEDIFKAIATGAQS